MKFINIPTDRLDEAHRFILDLETAQPLILDSAVQTVAAKYLAVTGANGVYRETDEDHSLPFLDVNFSNRFATYSGFDMTETVLAPATNEVTSTNISVGGYGLNNPLYYSSFWPFAAFGQMQVYLNLLGAGTQQFSEADLNRSSDFAINGPVANLATYNEYTATQLEALIKKYSAEGKPVTVSGMSTGGYTLLSSLANPKLLSDEVVSKIDAVFLDAPVPLGRAKFGLGPHLMRMAKICMENGYPQGLVGFSGEVTAGIIEKMMIADPKIPSNIAKEIAGQSFRATGVFPQIAFSTERDIFKNLHRECSERFEILKQIPITYFLRPNDHTVNTQRVLADVKTYQDLGYDVTVHFNELYPNSHVHAPLLTPRQALAEYGR
jgi:hypothetical protein